MNPKHTPGPWRIKDKSIMSENGIVIFKTTNNNEPSIYFSNALRIVECVNAMEGIENPKKFMKDWEKQMFNDVKSNYVKTMLLSKEELQKLGEQYANQEETPYVETSQPKATRIATKSKFSMPKELYELEAEMIEKIMNFQQDAIKYRNLKEVIENMIDRLDEGAELTLTKDSIIVLALKEAIK